MFDSITRGYFDTEGATRSVPHEHNFGSESYVLYGLTDRVNVGLIARFRFNGPSGRPGGGLRVGMGDLGLQIRYGLTRYLEGKLPSTTLVISETLPSGKYQRLSGRPADGVGTGAYATTLALYSQYFFWGPSDRLVRARFDLSYTISNYAGVQDISVYGTGRGFRGRASPGNSFLASGGWEYSVTRNWVLALDLEYQHDLNTRVSGFYLQQSATGPPAARVELNSGPSRSLSFAPAVEYNWSSRVGVIVGAKLTAVGRNTAAVIIPLAAINIFL